MRCPDCGGTGRIGAFVCVRDGSDPNRSIPCEFCAEQGYVAPEAIEARRQGDQARKDRIARGLTLRQEAARLGMPPWDLSQLEAGRTPAGQQETPSL